MIRPQWHQLAEALVCVRGSWKFERGRVHLDWDALGLGDTSDDVRASRDQYVELGTVAVLPIEHLSRMSKLGARFSNALVKYGLKSPFGDGWWIPVVRFREVEEELVALKADARVEVNALLNNFDAVIEQVTEAHYQLARQRVATKYRVPIEEVTVENELVADFLNEFVGALATLIPSRESISKRFSVKWLVTEVEPPRTLADGTNIRNLEAEAALLRSEIENLEANKSEASQEALVRAQRIEERLRIAREQESSAANLRQEMFEQIIDTVAVSARRTFVDALGCLKDKKKLSKPSLKRLRELVEDVRALNVGSAADLEQMAARLSDSLDACEAEPATFEALVEMTSAMETVLRADIVTVARAGRVEGLGDSEIEAIPEDRVRAARATLGFAIEEELAEREVILPQRGGILRQGEAIPREL